MRGTLTRALKAVARKSDLGPDYFGDKEPAVTDIYPVRPDALPRRISETLPQRLRIYRYLRRPFRRQYSNHRLSGAVISTPRHRSSALARKGPGANSRTCGPTKILISFAEVSWQRLTPTCYDGALRMAQVSYQCATPL